MGQTVTKNKRKLSNKKNKKFFITNGGIVLQKQIALSQGRQVVAGQFKIFSNEDLENATNNYDPDLMFASTYLRTVYRGTLEDRAVTVKAPQQIKPHPNLLDHHLTEVAMSVVMNHDNVLKLYGCCLETPVPVLVHEFFSNGSLFDNLHRTTSNRIQWVDRLRVAIDAGYAVSYMHTALSKPMVNRHINSQIILLGDSFHAKLSNFGFSVPINPGETPQKWPVEGQMGYIDPDCLETEEVTEKCDVYSFGVLLLELLTAKEPCMMAIRGTDLVDVFKSAVEKDCMTEMIDSEVLQQATTAEVERVAQLALACVAEKGDDRPTMIEVVEQLRHKQCQGK